MKKLQGNVSEPLNIQVYNDIKELIKKGKYEIGERIPNEDSLCKMYGVSRITVRAAVTRLVEDKILIKRHGKGTFVAMPVYVEKMSSGGSFTKSCIENNTVPSTKVLSTSIEKADTKVSRFLGVEKGMDVICIKRVRLVDGIQTIYEVDYFLKEFNFICQSDVENNPLADIVSENTGLPTEKFEDYFSVYRATKEMSESLDCSIGTPLLYIDQVVLGSENKIIYYNKQFILSDRYTCAFTIYKKD